ncbi:hypothetical protein Taro_002026, partial [Colocasia esculenta]|nr:hypothetical protein [Colocasia esculenta]
MLFQSSRCHNDFIRRPGGIQGVVPFGCEGRLGGIQGVVPFECEGRPAELGVVASLGGLYP